MISSRRPPDLHADDALVPARDDLALAEREGEGLARPRGLDDLPRRVGGQHVLHGDVCRPARPPGRCPMMRSALWRQVGGVPVGTVTVGACPAVPAGDRSAAGMGAMASSGLAAGDGRGRLVPEPLPRSCSSWHLAAPTRWTARSCRRPGRARRLRPGRRARAPGERGVRGGMRRDGTVGGGRHGQACAGEAAAAGAGRRGGRGRRLGGRGRLRSATRSADPPGGCDAGARH